MAWDEQIKKRLEDAIDEYENQITNTTEKIKGESEDPRSVGWRVPGDEGNSFWTGRGLYIYPTGLVVLITTGFISSYFLGWKLFPDEYFFNTNLAVCAALLVYIVTSIRLIPINAIAALLFFDKPVFSPRAGPLLALRGMYTVVHASVNYQDHRFPGSAESIFRISLEQQEARPEGDTPPENKVRPIFITTGSPELTKEEIDARDGKEHSFALDRQLTVDVEYFFRWRIHRELGGLFRLIRNLSDVVGDINERVIDLMREQTEAEAREVLAMLTPAMAIKYLTLVNKLFTLRVRLRFLRLGIDIDNSGGFVAINLGHKLNASISGVAVAELAARARVVEAEAKRQAAELEGKGEGARLKAIREGAGVSGQDILARDTATALAQSSGTVVFGESGFAQMAGVVNVLSEAFRKNNQFVPAPTEQPPAT